MQDTSGALLQAASGSHSGAATSIRSPRLRWWARTCHRRRRSRRKPAAACKLHVPYASHKEHAACRRASRREQAGRGRPVLKATCEHPDARLPSAICQMWRERPGQTAGPYRYATNDSLRLDGRDLLAPCCLAPTMSGDLSRSNARGRSDLHSPNDAWTSQTHDSPGVLQDRRGMNAASPPFRENGVARLAATDRSGFRRQIDGIG
jgi:hypothetical protein